MVDVLDPEMLDAVVEKEPKEPREPKINLKESAKVYLSRKKIEEKLEELRLKKELDDDFR